MKPPTRWLAVAIVSAGLSLATPAAGQAATQHRTNPNVRQGCAKTFTVKMVKRAVYWTYRGTRDVNRHDRLMVARIVRCERFPRSERYVRKLAHGIIERWRYRHAHPLQGPALASWYYDAGSTACGIHATYGFASLFLPCGAQITMYHDGRSVVATMEDHGPYIAGRTFDLNPALKAALGCSDLCSVYWR